MHLLALGGGPLLPVGDRALIQPEGDDDGLWRTAPSQQGDDADDQRLVVAQAIEGRALRRSESLAAFFALVAIVLQAVDDNVALARLSFGRAVHLRAECCLRVYSLIPSFLLAQKKKGSVLDSRFVKNQPFHALLWSYHFKKSFK